MPSQVPLIQSHIDDALARGGRALTGGTIDGGYVQPTVLVDVPEDSRAIQEETFGPTITVTRVRDADEAVERANDTTYGWPAPSSARRAAWSSRGGSPAA
jgi:aldehyde dehydrogenase (NAD+)